MRIEVRLCVSSARGWPRPGKEEPIMKEASKPEDEMLGEYDFRQGIRGKYAKEYASGTNIVVLDPDVASAFPNSESVNEALRLLIRVARALRAGS
jgi:hypothetical protein